MFLLDSGIGNRVVALILIASFFNVIVLAKPGTESVRNQYGLSEVANRNESISQGYHSTAAPGKLSESIPSFAYNDPAQNTEARSLFNDSDFFGERTRSTGKCFVEVLTSILVKSDTHIPAGNGSNPSVSIIEQCCQGYEPYVHNRSLCVPVCKKPCINGFCVRPEQCECFPDHVRSLNGDCVPTCPIGCLNGHCHSNGTCFCHPGYTLGHNGQYCIPRCSTGCGSLSNCTAPETCSCLNGYGLNPSTRTCDPICNPPCGNGNCSSPGTCSCFPGYALVKSTCQANCSRGCLGGRCVANEVCACDPGWTLDPNGAKCLPFCSNGCPNGNCTAPGICSCNRGYIKMGTGCKPHCERGCRDGSCTAPNTCSCRPGYYLNSLGNRCKLPFCSNGCSNGICTAPGVCSCNSGYIKIGTECKPHCERGCQDGSCTAPSTCSCQPGYYLNSLGNRCKRFRDRDTIVYGDSSKYDPIYNPPVLVQPVLLPAGAQPIPAPPYQNPPFHSTSMNKSEYNLLPPNPAPISPNINKPIYNSPVIVEEVPHPKPAQKPLNYVPNMTQPVRPSAPDGSELYAPQSEYDRQPAFNPYYQPKPSHPPIIHNPTYLEKQPAFNPHFGVSKTFRNRTTTRIPSRATTPKRKMSHRQETTVGFLQKTRRHHHNFGAKNSTVKPRISRTTTAMRSNSPICDRTCLNGRCTGRNHCTCNHGYTMASGSHHQCVPHCGNDCAHGRCIAPGVCACNVGYKKKNGKCVRI